MQYDKFIPSVNERFKAITIAQPLADALAYGRASAVVREEGSDYRGEILIVAAPSDKGERSGMMIAKGRLVDVRKMKRGYRYEFEGIRRVIEYPCQQCEMKGEVWDCYYTRGCVTEYPLINMRTIFGLPRISEEKK